MGNKILFIHGGPGLNCEPEREILTPHLAAAGLNYVFWDEPSNLRGDDGIFQPAHAYEHWLNSLRRKVEQERPYVLVALSFGAAAVIDLLNDYSMDSIGDVLFIGPTIDMNRVFKTMMSFSIADLRTLSPQQAKDLEHCLNTTKAFWDNSMQEGLRLVWGNPQLLTHYFVKPDNLTAWATNFSKPRFQIDFESQNCVLDDFAKRRGQGPGTKRFSIPVTVLHGEKDPVFAREDVTRLIQPRFKTLTLQAFKRCGHFPHLEDVPAFINLLRQMVGAN